MGANGNIATEYTARAKPDGHTIYITGADALAANMHIMKNPSVDVTKQLQLVATINRLTSMIAVNASSPVMSMADLTAAVKAKGDKASYATSNPVARVIGALYKERGGLNSVEVQYRTAADSLSNLTSGNLDYAVYDPVFASAQSKAGTIRILVAATGERMKAAPDYPTMS